MTTQLIPSTPAIAQPIVPTPEPEYEHEETRALVALVTDAAELVVSEGETAFSKFCVAGSRWRHDETYVFVLDPDGNMVVHPDAALEGTNQMALRDISGRPIIQGLIDAATAIPNKRDGWHHYQWPLPGGLFPRWKSSYVRLAQAPSGKRYIVGCGMYNERMERVFVIDAVANAVALIEARGQAAFASLRDPVGPFLVKDAYVFVIDSDGVDLVNPGFPNLEGRTILDLTDKHGTHLVREMIEVVRTRGSGWVDYMWPKPGESVSTQKSAYVRKAALGDRTVIVGCGVYLAEAPVEARPPRTTTASKLMTLVRNGAALLEEKGEAAYSEFRVQGSKWFHDTSYFFALTTDGTMAFHAAEPAREGERDFALDVLGRPFRRMILDAAAGASGEGWSHYMFPMPGMVFPAWKSTFAKRVTLPSGAQRILCSGIYNMQLDKALIEDVVHRAAALIAEHGRAAFSRLRDRTGPFMFMDTYVFVTGLDGTELVNGALPSLEGRNLMSLKDLEGTYVVRDEIALAMKEGSAWFDCYWFTPGDNRPALKQTFVQKVQSGEDIFVVGSGIYV